MRPPCRKIITGGMPPLSKNSRLNSSALREPEHRRQLADPARHPRRAVVGVDQVAQMDDLCTPVVDRQPASRPVAGILVDVPARAELLEEQQLVVDHLGEAPLSHVDVDRQGLAVAGDLPGHRHRRIETDQTHQLGIDPAQEHYGSSGVAQHLRYRALPVVCRSRRRRRRSVVNDMPGQTSAKNASDPGDRLLVLRRWPARRPRG